MVKSIRSKGRPDNPANSSINAMRSAVDSEGRASTARSRSLPECAEPRATDPNRYAIAIRDLLSSNLVMAVCVSGIRMGP